jgi:hypothetical protein
MPHEYMRNLKSNANLLEKVKKRRYHSVLFYALVATGNPKASRLPKLFFCSKGIYLSNLHQKCTRSQKKNIPETAMENQQIILGESSKKINWEFFRAGTDALSLENTGKLPNRQELPPTSLMHSMRKAARIGKHLFKPKITQLKEHMVGLSPSAIHYRFQSSSLLS